MDLPAQQDPVLASGLLQHATSRSAEFDAATVETRPSKAGTGGDVKKAGRPDPFAYMPLDRRHEPPSARHPSKSPPPGPFSTPAPARHCTCAPRSHPLSRSEYCPGRFR